MADGCGESLPLRMQLQQIEGFVDALDQLDTRKVVRRHGVRSLQRNAQVIIQGKDLRVNRAQHGKKTDRAVVFQPVAVSRKRNGKFLAAFCAGRQFYVAVVGIHTGIAHAVQIEADLRVCPLPVARVAHTQRVDDLFPGKAHGNANFMPQAAVVPLIARPFLAVIRQPCVARLAELARLKFQHMQRLGIADDAFFEVAQKCLCADGKHVALAVLILKINVKMKHIASSVSPRRRGADSSRPR